MCITTNKIRKLFLFALVFIFIFSSTASVFAKEDKAAEQLTIFGAAAEMANEFRAFGVNDQNLVTIMNFDKKAPSFYNSYTTTRAQSKTQELASTYQDRFNETWGNIEMVKFDPTIPEPKKEALSLMPRANGVLDGSPPADPQEQTERMDYIRSVFEKEYSADRYQPIIGQYLAYLYTSHYTENGTYNRQDPTPSFRKLLPNIISGEDITEYNAFFERCEDNQVLNNFNAIGKAVYDVCDKGILEAAVIEGLGDIKNTVVGFNDDIRQKFAEQGITEEKTVLTAIEDLTKKYILHYNAADTETGLVDLIVDTTDGGEALRGIVESYVQLFSLCSVSIYFNPVVGSLVGATWLIANIMGNAITRINLLSLATTLSSRVGYRLEVYAGLEPRP